MTPPASQPCALWLWPPDNHSGGKGRSKPAPSQRTMRTVAPCSLEGTLGGREELEKLPVSTEELVTWWCVQAQGQGAACTQPARAHLRKSVCACVQTCITHTSVYSTYACLCVCRYLSNSGRDFPPLASGVLTPPHLTFDVCDGSVEDGVLWGLAD